jgi:hypothetical protein
MHQSFANFKVILSIQHLRHLLRHIDAVVAPMPQCAKPDQSSNAKCRLSACADSRQRKLPVAQQLHPPHPSIHHERLPFRPFRPPREARCHRPPYPASRLRRGRLRQDQAHPGPSSPGTHRPRQPSVEDLADSTLCKESTADMSFCSPSTSPRMCTSPLVRPNAPCERTITDTMYRTASRSTFPPRPVRWVSSPTTLLPSSS